MPEFSIIIPTFNEAAGIADLLLTLQTLRSHCQIIIADGGSTDNTQENSAALVDQFICSNKGRAVQMNAGASHATGNILVFLHADTYLPEQAFTLIQQGIMAGAIWGRFDMQLLGQHSMLNIIALMMNWRSRLTGIATGDQVIFVKRSTFQQLGGFPEIALMEDIAISKQLNKLARPYCIAAKVKSSARRWESFGIWRTIALMWSIRLRYFLGEPPDHLAQLYRLGKFW
ncbi:MAG: glycosyltransferase [Methyloprofundus sp.]|nr:glycosyltransferase [Methyloprofundus sp.]